MFELMQPLTNQRPKDTRPVLVLSPTEGVVKISSAVADAMSVTANDYVTVRPANVKDAEGNVVQRFFLVKGNAQDGSTKQLGAKLAYTNGSSGALQFSSKNLYLSLGGSEEFNTKFKVHIGLEGQNEPVENGGKLYFMLEYEGKTAKVEKSAAAEGGADKGAAVMDDDNDPDLQ